MYTYNQLKEFVTKYAKWKKRFKRSLGEELLCSNLRNRTVRFGKRDQLLEINDEKPGRRMNYCNTGVYIQSEGISVEELVSCDRIESHKSCSGISEEDESNEVIRDGREQRLITMNKILI